MKELKALHTPVFFGDQALELFNDQVAKYKRVFFLADFRTLRKCLPLIENLLNESAEYNTLVIQEGERFKNINTCVLLWKQLQQLGAGKKDLFVNVGGGVVCDIGAFVASAYKRGMDFINIPTSLMAMSDAAIGGKSGVDLDEVKNQIGLITPPFAIYIYPPFLDTLDKRQFSSGMAEIIKHALIADEKLWFRLKEKADFSTNLLLQSVEIKSGIVTDDYYENGRRKILNFGHTIGHALESYSLIHDSNPLLHGEAIAMGMICEAFLSTQKNNLSSDAMKEISEYILSRFSKYHFSQNAIPELMSLLMHDKKNDTEEVNFSLLSSVGKCDFNIYCNSGEIINALNVYLDLKF